MEVKFEDLGKMDLIVDTIYKGGKNGNTGDDPLSKIFPKLGNMRITCVCCTVYIDELISMARLFR